MNKTLHTAVLFMALMVGTVVMPANSWADDGKLVASIASGGRLYDNWMRELTEKQPRTVHPLYPREGTFKDSPRITWRCSTCHGWDYRGVEGAFRTGPFFTGIQGIRGKENASVDDVAAVIGGARHGYSYYLDDEEILDIANFVVHGQTDDAQFIDTASGLAKGTPEAGSVVYSTVCRACHGADGRKMETLDPIGVVAREKPWEAYHRMLYGHPGGAMPALKVFSPQGVANVLAYVQSLPGVDVRASIARGGKLYDDWSRELRYPYPKDRQPAFPKDKKVADGSSTWRCVECHGWDYKGANGGPSLRKLSSGDTSVVIKALNNRTHDMKRFLKYRDMVDLANFISKGQVEMDEYIDPETEKARGDATQDTGVFLTICATCHGENGNEIRTMLPMGRVAREDPRKTLHKTLQGHPGEFMPAWQASVEPAIIRNLLAIQQALPGTR